MANLLGNGINQSDLVDLLVSIKTKWNAVMAKLDADATLTDDNYVSANALAIPEGIQTTEAKCIRDQGQIVTFLQSMITQFNAVLAKLDADTLAGLDNDYASTLGITDIVGNDAIDAITNTGMTQGAVIKLLNTWITNYNLLLTKMDTDPLAASDYASGNAITDTVEEGGTYSRMRSIALFLAIGGSLLGPLMPTPGFAAKAFQGDLFPYEFKHSSFTVEVNTEQLDRFSIQVVASTESISSESFNGGHVSVGDDTITVSTGNKIGQGMPVLLSVQGVAAPSPLATGTTYFAVRISDSLLKLATTYAQAVSRDTIDILTNPGGSWTLIPRALNTGAAGYLWYASNDGTNWTQVASVGSTVNGSTQSLVSMGSSSTNARIFDWGEFAYKYLRFTFNGPSLGAIKLRAFIFGRTRD